MEEISDVKKYGGEFLFLPVSFVMRAKRNKFNRFVPACRTIMTKNDFLIYFPAANQAVQINDDDFFLQDSCNNL